MSDYEKPEKIEYFDVPFLTAIVMAGMSDVLFASILIPLLGLVTGALGLLSHYIFAVFIWMLVGTKLRHILPKIVLGIFLILPLPLTIGILIAVILQNKIIEKLVIAAVGVVVTVGTAGAGAPAAAGATAGAGGAGAAAGGTAAAGGAAAAGAGAAEVGVGATAAGEVATAGTEAEVQVGTTTEEAIAQNAEEETSKETPKRTLKDTLREEARRKAKEAPEKYIDKKDEEEDARRQEGGGEVELGDDGSIDLRDAA